VGKDLIQADRITKRFGGLVAVNDFSFRVSEGEIRGIIGPNGSGKTTLFNMISGLFPPTSGSIMFEGRPITGLPMNKVAYLRIRRTFQQISLFRGLSVIKSVMIGAHPYQPCRVPSVLLNSRRFRRQEADIVGKSREALRVVGLQEKAHLVATNLPYGQQRLVEIARALVSSPKLLLLDEPVAGMNPQEIETARRIVLSIKDSGITVIIVEHNMGFIMGLSEKLTVISSGEKIAEGDPADIKKDTRVVECYLGRGMTRAGN
jgi:branched-chain amino acid transport system ATP-binding protein